jgi:hypothetical protein
MELVIRIQQRGAKREKKLIQGVAVRFKNAHIFLKIFEVLDNHFNTLMIKFSHRK